METKAVKTAKAVLRFVHIAPRKARYVIDTIRGKKAGEALTLLKFTKRHAARVVTKILQSAVANAQQKEMGDVDDLVVERAMVDGGVIWKRTFPRPRGHATIMRKRTSHITLVLSSKSDPADRPYRQRRRVARSRSSEKAN